MLFLIKNRQGKSQYSTKSAYADPKNKALRYREEATQKVRFVHTLNGSGVALARTLIALLETHQNADGSVTLPRVLRPYLSGLERLTPR